MFPSSQFLCNLLMFSFLIALIKVSSSMLYRINERGPLYLFPNFSGTMSKALSLSTVFAYFFFFYNRDTLDQIRTILFFSYFAKNFFLNLEYMLTLLIALSASFDMTL